MPEKQIRHVLSQCISISQNSPVALHSSLQSSFFLCHSPSLYLSPVFRSLFLASHGDENQFHVRTRTLANRDTKERRNRSIDDRASSKDVSPGKVTGFERRTAYSRVQACPFTFRFHLLCFNLRLLSVSQSSATVEHFHCEKRVVSKCDSLVS